MKMKNAVLLNVSLIFALISSACFLGLETQGKEGVSAGKGAIHLTIAGSDSRTIFPNGWQSLTYHVKFSATGKEDVTTSFTGTSDTVELEAGTWKIDIEAKNGENLVGTASIASVQVTDGDTTELISIRIVPVTGGANGTVQWSVEFPDGLGKAMLYYQNVNGDIDGEINLLDDSIDIDEENAHIRFGTISLKPDSWLFWAVLENSDSSKSAGNAEAVHVYSGMYSEFHWEFYEASFTATKPLNGSVQINASSGVTVNTAYLYSADLGLIYLTPSTGNTWVFNGVVPEELNILEGELVITTANSTLSKHISVAYSANIILEPAVNIVALTANVGSGGVLYVNEQEYTKQIDLFSGTIVYLVTDDDPGYTRESLQVGSSAYTGGFSITANTVVTVTFTFNSTDTDSMRTLWEWKQSSSPWPTAGLNSGQGNSFYAAGFTNITVRTYGGNGMLPTDTGNNGIRMGAVGTGTAGRLVIGQTDNFPTTGTTDNYLSYKGEFDLSDKQIQITIDYENITAYTGRYFLRLYVNNNTSTAGDSVHGSQSQIYSFNNPNAVEFTNLCTPGSTAAKGTVVLTFTPSIPILITTAPEALSAAFFCLHAQNSGAAGQDNGITITGIKIEYPSSDPLPDPGDADILLAADVSQADETYAYIKRQRSSGTSIFGIEAPDDANGGHEGVPHIRMIKDETYPGNNEKEVFAFDLHLTPGGTIDGNATGDQTRQRIELKIDSNDYRGFDGRSFTYRWKFKLPSGFTTSSDFTHIHQIKNEQGDASAPIISLTARNAVMQLIYRAPTYNGASSSNRNLVQVSLSNFLDVWAQAEETITYSSNTNNAAYSIRITRVDNPNAVLLAYTHSAATYAGLESNVSQWPFVTWRSGNSYGRPKYGIYRTIYSGGNLISGLKSETVLYADFELTRLD